MDWESRWGEVFSRADIILAGLCKVYSVVSIVCFYLFILGTFFLQGLKWEYVLNNEPWLFFGEDCLGNSILLRVGLTFLSSYFLNNFKLLILLLSESGESF